MNDTNTRTEILIIDDETGILDTLTDILGDEGYTTHTAANAEEARQKNLQHKPQLILLDIWMPDTDGVTLLKEWRAAGLLTMPVIMMSGHATMNTANEASRIGAQDFLEKPITLQKLLKAVQQALRRDTPAPKAAPAPLPRAATPALAAIATPLGGQPASAQRPQEPEPTGPKSRQLFDLDSPLREARDLFEKTYFEYHLAMENGSMTRVAEKTGLERTHLYRKLRQLGIDLSRNRKGNQDAEAG